MAQYYCPTIGWQVNTTGVLSDTSGEGVIYHTDKPGYIAKIYKPDKLTPEKPHKLQIMVNHPPADPAAAQGFCSIAWPKDLLFNHQGQFEGFLMPIIAGAQSMEMAIYPKIRRQHFPKFDWEAMHVAAANVASIFGAVHDRQYVIGDVKPQNLLIDQKGRVAIIDTDSFQISDPRSGRNYPCTVYTADFLPVEVLSTPSGANPARTRLPTEDYFGLGVLIHFLLFGHHAFQGAWNYPGDPPETPGLITAGYFPYAPGSKLTPGPKLVPIHYAHPKIKALLFRCFIEGHKSPSRRPTALEWRETLLNSLKDMSECPVGHVFCGANGDACGWCARKAMLNSEPFPPCPDGRSSRLRRLARQILSHVSAGAYRDAVKEWVSHPEIHENLELRAKRQEIERAERDLRVFDVFVAAYRRDSDPADLNELLKLWSSGLDASPALQTEKLNGKSPVAMVMQIREREQAIRAVSQVIAAAGPGPFTPVAEAAIGAAWTKHQQVLIPNFNGSVIRAASGIYARAKQATDRLKKWPMLEAALVGREERQIIRTWGAPGLMDQYAPAVAARAQVEAARRKVACLDRFEDAATKSDSDEDELWRIWASEPGMDQSVASARPSSKLGGLSPHNRVQLARARLDAFDSVAGAVARQGGSPQSESGETEIVKVWDRYRALVEPVAVGPRAGVAQRVQDARRRVDTVRQLVLAVAADDDRQIAQAFGDGKLLSTYAPAMALQQRAERAATCVSAMEAIAGKYKSDPEDDAALVDVWAGCADLQTARGVNEPDARLGGHTIRAIVELAIKRLAILRRIQSALLSQPPRIAEIATHWDEALCRSHKSFASLLTQIDRSIETHKRLEDLVAVVQTSDHARICALWDEAMLGNLPEAQRLRPQVIEAFREHQLGRVVLRPAAMSAWAYRNGRVHLRWKWDDPQLQLCAVAVREGRYPRSLEDVAEPGDAQTITRDLYNARGEAVIPFSASAAEGVPYASIWPVVALFGRRITGPNVLLLGKPGSNLPLVRYRLRRAGRRSLLEIETGGADLKEMLLLAAPGYPPQRDDPNAVEVEMEIDPKGSDEPGKLMATLKRPSRLRGPVMVRLHTRQRSEAGRYRFAHPSGIDATFNPS